MSRRRNADLVRLGPAAAEAERVGAVAAVPNLVLGAYTRISDDQEGEETGDRGAGVARQFGAIQDLCKALSRPESNWMTKSPVYEDNDVSAFKDVVRPGFEQLLTDLEAGVIDGIVVYDLDRLARRPKDLERVIDIYDRAAKVRRPLHFRTVHDAIDLSSPDGITLARVMVAFANKASRDTGRRVAAKHRATALTGRPVSGTRPFGWNWTRGAVTLANGRVLPEVTKSGSLGNQAVNTTEAGEVRRIAADLLGGRSINSVVRDLNGRGVMTSRGNPWTGATVKQMMLSPRLAGFRVHQGEVFVDPRTKKWVMGQWDPILDVQTWTALEDSLMGGTKVTAERRSEAHREYLLSGLLRCSECHGPLHGNARGNTHFYYACKARGGGVDGAGGCGRVSASGLAVDELVEALLKARMRSGSDDQQEGPSWAGAEAYEAIRAKIQERFAAYDESSGDVARQLLAQVTSLQEQADALKLEQSEWLREQSRLRRLRTVGPDAWQDMSVADRRAYARMELKAIIVRRATRGGNRFDPGRLVPVWRSHAPAGA